MADFAKTKEEFPESNDFLGAGKNANTYGIPIFRNAAVPGVSGETIITKVILTPAEVEEIYQTGTLYIWVKAPTTYPLSVQVHTPFLTQDDIDALVAADVETVNERLRELLSLERVSEETTMEKAQRINMDYQRNVFDGCPNLMLRITQNSMPDLLNGLGEETKE